jgi:uric acid transporter
VSPPAGTRVRKPARQDAGEAHPVNFQVIFGSSITSTVIVVFTLNLVFNHWSWRRKGESAVEVAVREGAVAVNVPDDVSNRNDRADA